MTTIETQDRLIDEKEVSRLIGLSVRTLQQGRWSGAKTLPPFLRVGAKAVRYRLSDVMAIVNGEATHWTKRDAPTT